MKKKVFIVDNQQDLILMLNNGLRAHGYLVKPVDMDDLLALITRVCGPAGTGST